MMQPSDPCPSMVPPACVGWLERSNQQHRARRYPASGAGPNNASEVSWLLACETVGAGVLGNQGQGPERPQTHR